MSEGTIEEKIIERAFRKLFLDAMVIQQGRLVEKNKGSPPKRPQADSCAAASKDELLEMIRFGADEVVRITDVQDPTFVTPHPLVPPHGTLGH
jgi:SWI/SNF-related matrix-associated actin-dependent regulator of chromatin subfamily A member 5